MRHRRIYTYTGPGGFLAWLDLAGGQGPGGCIFPVRATHESRASAKDRTANSAVAQKIKNVTRPWPVLGLSLACPWPVLGLSLAYPWPVRGLSLACPWFIVGLSLACPWPVLGLSLACPWPVLGLSLASPLPVLGLSFACPWPVLCLSSKAMQTYV